jgi:hypothetical protein
LIWKLASASGRLDRGDDRIKVAEASLAAVVAFLHEDGAVLLGGVTRPLLLVQAALDKAAKGGRPALFWGRQKAQNRPAGDAFDVARGQLAALLDTLIGPDLRAGEAAKWLAGQVAERAITHDGKEITPHMLRRWREVVRERKAPRRLLNMFENVKRKVPPELNGRQDTERWCVARLEALRRIFP